ncbi:MAG: sensor histidine kinase [Aminipila sp.]
MNRKNTKHSIYIRTFSSLFAIYLLLLAGFSIFLILQEKKEKGMELEAYTFQINNPVEEIIQENMDQNNHISDTAKLKREFVNNVPVIYGPETELAIYTGNYELVYHTNDYWICSYTEYSQGNTNYTGYGYLDVKKWFDKKEVKELENYRNAAPKAKKPGDLDGYSLDIEGFWLDNEMVIPDKIYVTPLYASSIDKDGNVTGSGTRRDNLVYSSGYKNTEGLPYYKFASIQPGANANPDSEKRIALRNMVLDKEKLEKSVNMLSWISYEPINPVTYRYYLAMPYQNTIMTNEGKNYSASWTVVAREINLLNQCTGTLAFVWGSCFIAFLAVAQILSAQTYKTYKKREELEMHRKETTKALAHDLKTPLSIISGYAQNLIENIRTEKREYYAANIQANVTRMDTIIREMLELSRLEADHFQKQFEDVSLNKVCADLMDRYSLVCCEKSIEACLEGDAVVKADYVLIQRVIDNFFINALDHTPDGGTIHIRITNNSTLKFYNSGSHIPEEKVNEIWKPFKKADESRSNTRGTGLGLSISSRILELYHFSYGAENEDDGVIFWFKFA